MNNKNIFFLLNCQPLGGPSRPDEEAREDINHYFFNAFGTLTLSEDAVLPKKTPLQPAAAATVCLMEV